jgi:hypothetical protein
MTPPPNTSASPVASNTTAPMPARVQAERELMEALIDLGNVLVKLNGILDERSLG